MGIYDREYYRSDGSGFLGTLARRGSAWRWVIGINVVAFVVQLATAQRGVDGWFTNLFSLDTAAVLDGQVWRLLTGTFLHAFAWQHIVFNMLIIWWAGSEVEDIYGPREFVAFYLAAAVFSSGVYVGWNVLNGQRSTAIGASGAATAVLLLFALHYPTRIVYFMFFIPMPVMLLVAIYILADALGMLGAGFGGNIAFAAHLGGAAFGYLYFKMQWRMTSLWPSGVRWRRPGRARANLRVYRGEHELDAEVVPAAAAAPAPRPVPDSQLEAELDAVLEKVARQGKSSLTERENQILMRASEIFRRRRK
jgi:membrane associated rhomboid family serine protease